MTELLRLKNIGNYGINSDIAAWELGPEFITEGNNFRVRNGSIRPFGGADHLVDGPSFETDVGFLKYIRTEPNDFWVQASREKIHVIYKGGSGWQDISSKAYDLSKDEQYDWTGAQLGQYLIMNNQFTYPEYWLNTAQETMKGLPFRPIPDTLPVEFETWEDLGYTCKSMRAHKNFLIALNISDDLGIAPNGYRISSAADANGLPFSWDTDDRSSIAIRAQLGGDGGEIIDGLTLRDSFIIYSTDSIDSLTFNPNSEFYWQRREQSSTIGLLNKNSLVEVKGKHYLIADGDILVNDGTNIQSILYGRLQRRFNSGTNEYSKVNSFAVRNDALKEIWFCVPENLSELPNVAYVYNWHDNSWSIRDLPDGIAFADYGASTFDASEFFWSGAKGSWADQTATWASTRLTALDDILVGVYTTGIATDLDPKGPVDGNQLNCVVERTDFPLMDNRGNVTITRVYPTAYGEPFEIQFGSQQNADGDVAWLPYQTFTPGVDRKVDFRSTGELLCWRVRSIGGNRFRLSGLEVEFVAAGVR